MIVHSDFIPLPLVFVLIVFFVANSLRVKKGCSLKAHERIVLALDVENAEKAFELVQLLKGKVGVFKVGLELVIAAGPAIFDQLRAAGANRIFYDAKLHDIPNTVAGAMRGVSAIEAWCVTVHACGGSAMMRAAVETAKQHPHSDGITTKVLAVTVLTSISQAVLTNELSVGKSVTDQVVHLAKLAHQAGCDGVIASPHEIEAIRTGISYTNFLIITPGVRPADSAKGDQARVMTPAEAISKGADYLVIGRPITVASDPQAAAQAISQEIEAASE